MSRLRPARSVAVLALALLSTGVFVACGEGDKKGGVEPETTPARRAPPSPAPAIKGPLPKVVPPTPAPVPPGKTRLTEARFAELSTLDAEGFKRTVVKAGTSSLIVTFEAEAANAKGVKPYVTARLEHCFLCQPMDVAAWKENKSLRGMLTSVAAGDPGLVFDVHEADLGTRKGIGLYTASFVSGGGSTASMHGYQVWFNDGANQILVDVSPRGLYPKSRDEMLAAISRDDMAAVARAVFALYASDF